MNLDQDQGNKEGEDLTRENIIITKNKKRANTSIPDHTQKRNTTRRKANIIENIHRKEETNKREENKNTDRKRSHRSKH